MRTQVACWTTPSRARQLLVGMSATRILVYDYLSPEPDNDVIRLLPRWYLHTTIVAADTNHDPAVSLPCLSTLHHARDTNATPMPEPMSRQEDTHTDTPYIYI